MAIEEKKTEKTVEKSQINGTIMPLPMPMQLRYNLIIENKDSGNLWLVEPEDNVQITRAIDCVPSKLTFKVPKNPNLNFEEGDIVKFLVNGGIIFLGFIFKNSVMAIITYLLLVMISYVISRTKTVMLSEL